MLFLSFQSPHNGDDLSEGEGDVGSPDDEMAQKVRNVLFVIPVLYELFIQIGIINIEFKNAWVTCWELFSPGHTESHLYSQIWSQTGAKPHLSRRILCLIVTMILNNLVIFHYI